MERIQEQLPRALLRLGRFQRVQRCFSNTEENKQIKRKVSFSDVKFKMLKDSCVSVQVGVANVALPDGGMCRSKKWVVI